MVFHDVPPWIDEPKLKEIFQQKPKPLQSTKLLNWTLRDVSTSAWKITGQDLKPLNGAIICAPGRSRAMCMISFEKYVADRSSHFDKIRAKPKRTSAHRPAGN